MAYADEVLTDAPTAFWRLGEASGTVAAEENGFYDGTYIAAPTLGVAGAVIGDTGVTFTPAQAEAVSIADVVALRPETSNYTVEFWIKRNGNPSANEYVYAKPGGGGTGSFHIQLMATGFLSLRHAAVTVLDTDATVTDNAWHHIVFAVTRSGTSRVYIDGVENNTAATAAYTINTASTLVLGARQTGTPLAYNNGLNGSLDEVAFYKGTVLSSGRVTAHFDAATEGGTPGPWPLTEDFDEPNGTQLTNLAGWVRHPDGAYAEGNAVVGANRIYEATPVNALFYHTADPPSSDYTVEGDIYVHTLLGGTAVGVAGRVDETNADYYELAYVASEVRWRLARVIDGTTNEIGSYSQALTPATTYTAQLSMIGPVIRAYVDGTLRIAVTDATPITTAGHAGVVFRGAGGPATATTGIHIAELLGDDTTAPEATITFVAAGTVASSTAPTGLTPGLPGGVAAGDMLLVAVYGGPSMIPSPNNTAWLPVFSGSGVGGRLAVYRRIYNTGVTAPAFSTSGSGGAIAQVAAFRGVDPTNPIGVAPAPEESGTATTNIGPLTGFTPGAQKSAVLAIAGRGDDWTSVATLSGDSLTWAEIGEPDDATRALGLVWNYAIQPGDPTAVTDKTFTVTGGSGIWRGRMMGLRAAATTTPTPPGTAVTKVRVDGAWVTKPLKVRISGSWVTKPVKVIGHDVPPPPPPPPDPDPDDPPPPDPDPGTGVRAIMWISDRFLTPEGRADAGNITTIATTADLTWLKQNGVDGFTVAMGRLPFGFGSATAAFQTRLAGVKAWANAVSASHGFKIYIGCHLANNTLRWTPVAPWFDDTSWNNMFEPAIDLIAEAVADSAIQGIAFDGENYPVAGVPVTSGWGPGNDPTTATEAQVKAQARVRGVEVATRIVNITGPIDIAHYYWHFPGSANERSQFDAGNTTNPNSYDSLVDPFWGDGLASVSGVTFRLWDSVFYKNIQGIVPPHPAGTWDGMYRTNLDGWEALPVGKRPNAFCEPFIWITIGPSARTQIAQGINPPTHSNRQRTDPEISLQLAKARQYTQGSEFAIYEQNCIHPPSIVRYTGTWPQPGAQQTGGYACYGGVAGALRSASA